MISARFGQNLTDAHSQTTRGVEAMDICGPCWGSMTQTDRQREKVESSAYNFLFTPDANQLDFKIGVLCRNRISLIQIASAFLLPFCR